MAARIKSEEPEHAPMMATHIPRTSTPSINNPVRLSHRPSSPVMANIHHQQPSNDVGPPTPASSSQADNNHSEHAMHALNLLASKRIKIIQELEALNLRNAVPSLPKLVIIGDQSAGKSSIVEAICNVSLPRSDNTCTRVPYAISTSASDSLPSCDVSFLYKYDHDRTSTTGDFLHWVERTPLSVMYARGIKDKHELGEVLRGAQACLLQTYHTTRQYQGSDTKQATPLQFSPNVICLKITGPDLPELAFYDLPGIICSTERREDEYLIDFVGNLTKTYLKDDKALVMLACPANQDMQNCSAFTYMRKADAESRCLGVLTKPDLLDEDGQSEQSQKRLTALSKNLAGNGYTMGKGWYVSRQPSQKELDEGITHSNAKELEEKFFAQGIWTRDLAKHRGQFGLPNLNAAVSKHLDEHILSELPHIAQQIRGRLAGVQDELAGLPAQNGSPAATVLRVITDLGRTVERMMDPGNSSSQFPAALSLRYKGFLTQLEAMSPQLDGSSPDHDDRIKETKRQMTSEAAERAGDSVMLLDSDDEEPSPTPASNKRKAQSTPASFKRQRTMPPESSPSKTSATRVTFSLADVRSIGNAKNSSLLPGAGAEQICDEIIRQSLVHWQVATETFVKDTVIFVKKMLKEIIHEELRSYQLTGLFNQTRIEITHWFSGLANNIKDETSRILNRELECRGSTSDLKTQTAEVQAAIDLIRDQARVREYYELQEVISGKAIDKQKKVNAINDPAARAKETCLKQADPDRALVQHVIAPFAYYNHAALRFADSVSMLLRHDFVRVIHKEFLSTLMTALGVSSNERCEELLAEDPELASRRKALLDERARLQAGLAKLDELSDGDM